MPVYEHSNIDFGKTQTHFRLIQVIFNYCSLSSETLAVSLRKKVIQV